MQLGISMLGTTDVVPPKCCTGAAKQLTRTESYASLAAFLSFGSGTHPVQRPLLAPNHVSLLRAALGHFLDRGVLLPAGLDQAGAIERLRMKSMLTAVHILHHLSVPAISPLL